MNRILIILALILSISLGSGFVGYRLAKGSTAISVNNTLNQQIGDDNEKKQKNTEQITEVEKLVYKVQERIVYLPSIPTNSDCSLRDAIKLQQSVYEEFPEVLFQ